MNRGREVGINNSRKNHRPPVTLERTHLIERLWSLNSPRVTFLIAPAGYGKTTLLALAEETALSAGQSVITIDLRSEKHFIERLKAQLTALDRSRHPTNPAGHHPDQWAQHLLRLPPTLITFDHVESLSLEAERWLCEFLHHLPAGHRLLLAGRNHNILELPVLVATGKAQLLGPEELAFTEQEQQRLLGRPLTPDLRTLAGWPMGVNFVANSGGRSAKDLFSTLIQSVPSSFQAQMPFLAPYPVWTEDLPRRINLDLPDGWLAVLTQARWHLTYLGGGRYRPHSQITEVLDDQLKLRGELRRDAYRKAAGAAPRCDLAATLQLLLRAELFSEAAEFLKSELPALHTAGDAVQIGELTLLMPLSALKACPPLLLSGAQALLETGQLVRAQQLLRTLDQDPLTRWQALPLLAQTAAQYGHFVQAQQYIEEAAQHAERYELPDEVQLNITAAQLHFKSTGQAAPTTPLLELLSRCTALQHAHWRALILAELSAADRQRNLLSDAAECSAQSQQIAEDLQRPHLQMIALQRAAETHLAADHHAAAHTFLDRALKIAQHLKFSQQSQIHLALADLHVTTCNLDQALPHLHSAVDAARRFNQPDCHVLAELNLADTLRLLGTTGADQHLCRAEQLLRLHPQLSQHLEIQQRLSYQRAHQALQAGNLALSLEHFQAAMGAPENRCAAQARLWNDVLQDRNPELLGLECEERHVQAYQNEQKRPMQEGGPAVRPRPETHYISLTTFAELSITLNGSPLKWSGRNVQRGQELLAILALLPPATSNELESVLISGGKGNHRDALRTLRQTLSEATGIGDPIVQNSLRQYVLNPAFTISSDFQALREAVDQRHYPALSRLADASENFLPGMDKPWINEIRTEELPDLRYTALGLLHDQAQRDGLHAQSLRYLLYSGKSYLYWK